MGPSNFHVSSSSLHPEHKALQQAALIAAQQVETTECLAQECEYAEFNPLAQMARSLTWNERNRRWQKDKSDLKESDESENAVVHKLEAIASIAYTYERKHPELRHDLLLSLDVEIHADSTTEEILDKILSVFPDPYLADETLNYLLETTSPSLPIVERFTQAKEILAKRYSLHLQASKNIDASVQAFSTKGIGSSIDLRALYVEILTQPREPLQLFENLVNNYSFQKMAQIIAFALHSLGIDMKSKGPSIDKRELQHLYQVARTMQAILSVYRFFLTHRSSLAQQFALKNIPLPPQLTFEALSKQLVLLIKEKYPSCDKVLHILSPLGLHRNLPAQIIVISLLHRATREAWPQLFYDNQHRQNLLMVLVETLSDLDDLLDEEELPPPWQNTP